MFRDKLKFLKSGIDKEGSDGVNDKKKIENIVVFIIVLIITIIAINFIWKDDKKSNKLDEQGDYSKKLATIETSAEVEKEEDTTKDNLEKKLKNILEKMQGVGKVEVFINYSESSEVVAMFNENSKSSLTEETDTTGGKRTIEETDTQKDIIYKEDDGQKIPITQKTIQPKIEGAIITAQGAKNDKIKANIVQAVEAATGLATHKIQVFQMEG
ncbi:MAG: hypothetical protein IKF97_06180 [Clostridia bacterium]|nr:hypothetical protein [Clostridia bacterium]